MLKIAVSQFPVRDDIAANLRYMLAHIARAARHGADIVHFPETSLSGYEMADTETNRQMLDGVTREVAAAAKKTGIHVIFGTYHRDPSKKKPYNSTYVLSRDGSLLGRYDKINLYGAEAERFAVGSDLLTLDIEGVKCWFLICYDSSFPELFAEYRRRGVEILFLSYYNAASRKGKNDMDRLMEAQFVTRSTDSGLYISGSNSSARYSRMPASFVYPDGRLLRLDRHKPGLLYADFPGEPLGWTLQTYLARPI